ncbi:hemerythrin domain-containing protein [Hydrogenophaga sp.]|uniref:hemerythrin domain-containing protein n=1 Tax=Hydrogenophaga sp. TaxID=1904254 RepID=UPI003F729410
MMRVRGPGRARDALYQLQLEHEAIRRLLREFDRLRLANEDRSEEKAEVVDGLCDALSLHVRIGEELFEPLSRLQASSDPAAFSTQCDHRHLVQLIAQLDELEPGDAGYDDAVGDIADCVMPCMDGEMSLLRSLAREALVDTQELGERMNRLRKVHQGDFTRVEVGRQRA